MAALQSNTTISVLRRTILQLFWTILETDKERPARRTRTGSHPTLKRRRSITISPSRSWAFRGPKPTAQWTPTVPSPGNVFPMVREEIADIGFGRWSDNLRLQRIPGNLERNLKAVGGWLRRMLASWLRGFIPLTTTTTIRKRRASTPSSALTQLTTPTSPSSSKWGQRYWRR